MKPAFNTTNPLSQKEKTCKECYHPSSSNQKKFHVQPSAGKVMLTLFWNDRGVILDVATSAMYTNLLTNHLLTNHLLTNHLLPAIKYKQCEILSKGVLWEHDSDQLHTSRAITATVEELYCQCLPHLSYPLDLTFSDFHQFVWHKNVIGRKYFQTWWRGSAVGACMVTHEPREFISAGIQALYRHWKTCTECSVDYAKTW